MKRFMDVCPPARPERGAIAFEFCCWARRCQIPPPERAVEFTHVHTSRSCRSNANPKNSSLSKSLYSAICSQEELTGLFRQVVDFRLIFETCESNSPFRGRDSAPPCLTAKFKSDRPPPFRGREIKNRPALRAGRGWFLLRLRSGDQSASGSGRIWKCTTLGRLPLPPSTWKGVRLPAVVQMPRPFQPPLGSSMRPSMPLA
jgi:hypothetical protein